MGLLILAILAGSKCADKEPRKPSPRANSSSMTGRATAGIPNGTLPKLCQQLVRRYTECAREFRVRFRGDPPGPVTARAASGRSFSEGCPTFYRTATQPESRCRNQSHPSLRRTCVKQFRRLGESGLRKQAAIWEMCFRGRTCRAIANCYHQYFHGRLPAVERRANEIDLAAYLRKSKPPSSPSADPQDRTELGRRCGRLNDTVACYRLAKVLSTKGAPAAEHARARGLNEKACDGGELRGCNNLALQLERGMGGSKDPIRARSLYGRACVGRVAVACLNLGRVRLQGIGGVSSLRSAREAFRKGCRIGPGGGCDQLGALRLNGQGGPRDPAGARKALTSACRGAPPAGCGLLSIVLATGVGGPVDQPAALRAARIGCKARQPGGCLIQGLYLMSRPHRTPATLAPALKSLQIACKGGMADGCRHLRVVKAIKAAGAARVLKVRVTVSSGLGGSPASNLTDGRLASRWQPRDPEDAWLRLDFGREVILDRAEIAHGPRTGGRVTSVEMRFSGGKPTTVDVADRAGFIALPALPPRPTRWIRLTLLSVRGGSRRSGPVVSEVRAFGWPAPTTGGITP